LGPTGRPDSTTQLTVAWVTPVGGAASETPTAIVHDEAWGVFTILTLRW